MTVRGIDYSFSRPAPAAVKAAGYEFVIRYLCPGGPPKRLTRAEADELAAEGLWIVTVWESTATRMLAGQAAGQADARAAQAQARACGMPAGRPVFFAADFDANAWQVATAKQYLAGAAQVLGHGNVGIYGGIAAVTAALDARAATWAFQTIAWSAGRWDPRAQIRQLSINNDVAGASADLDEAMAADYGAWQPGKTPAAAAHPAAKASSQEDEMPSGVITAAPGVRESHSWLMNTVGQVVLYSDWEGTQDTAPVVNLRIAHNNSGGSVYDAGNFTLKTNEAYTITSPGDVNGCSFTRIDDGRATVAWHTNPT